MVVEYNDEYCKIMLRKDINTEPYEVIDIVDLLEVWEKHKADTPQTDLGKPIECDGCGEHICIGCEHQEKKEAWRKAQTDCGWK